MNLNDIVQAGTGYLTGKTQGLDYRHRREMEVERERRRQQAEQFNQRLRVNADVRAMEVHNDTRPDALLRHELEAIPLLGEANRGVALQDSAAAFDQRLGQIPQEHALNRELAVGSAEEDIARANASIQEQFGMSSAELARQGGADLQVTPGGVQIVPHIDAEIDRELKQVNLRRQRTAERLGDLEVDQVAAQFDGQGGYEGIVAQVEKEIAAGNIRRMADSAQAYNQLIAADHEMRLRDVTSASELLTAELLAKGQAASVMEWALEVEHGLVEPMPYESWLELKGKEKELEHWKQMQDLTHAQRMREITTPRPPTYQYSGYTPERAAIEETNAAAKLVAAEASLLGALTEATGGGADEVDLADFRSAAASYMQAKATGNANQAATALNRIEEITQNSGMTPEEISATMAQVTAQLDAVTGGGPGKAPTGGQGPASDQWVQPE